MLCDKLPDVLNTHSLFLLAQRLLLASDYACRHIDVLEKLLIDDDGQCALSEKLYHQGVQTISYALSFQDFSTALRQFRHYHLLRLVLRELAQLDDTRNTIAAWSDCADALIMHGLRYCELELSKRYGFPCDESGHQTQLYVLAMGKLGGKELNFSSDIDLIFAFSDGGVTNGSESISNVQFYSKAVQNFIKLFQTNTTSGFVFRVDLRLRPNGDSGPLVSSFAAMETYYQEQGRDWERYAMVKARLIGADLNARAWFERLMIPFVYRRYVDFSVIESLRSMKGMIEREVRLNPMLNDIKRGRGGIREIEFIIQCFQLIRGGRLPQLQQQNAMAALFALKQHDLLPHTVALQQAYLFLRRLENALQLQNDQQTHTLPTDSIKQAQLILLLGYASWDDLLAKLNQFQRIVSHAFQGVLGKVNDEDDDRLLTNQLGHLWQGQMEASMSINLLTSLGYQDAQRCYQMIYAFRHAPRCRRLTQAARLRLDRFMALLLMELASVQSTEVVLLAVMRLLDNIVGRSAYLALLTENPPVLKELLHWFAHSPFMTSMFVGQPFLLEELIDQGASWRPLSKNRLEDVLCTRLSACSEPEQEDEVLREFKLTCWLLAARAELYEQCDAVRMGQFLAAVAQVIINQVVVIACQRLSARYPGIKGIRSHFAIIAYGKLGSREMNYDSDVDLVFLHQVNSSEEGLVTRLTQKILHMLTTRLQGGILYAVDTRLRPSGEAGLLVSHMDAFIDYQRSHAWTWEHQALSRARVIFARPTIRRQFNQLKQDVLLLPRDRQTLQKEIHDMRAKINKHLDHHTIKHVEGGLLDLEFLVQFLILAYPTDTLVRMTNTLAQLRQLYRQGSLTKAQWTVLQRGYRYYHQALHQALLQPGGLLLDGPQAEVMEICCKIYNRTYNICTDLNN